MIKFDREKLEHLIAAGQWDMARQMLESFLDNQESHDDDPELQATMALVYLSVMLKISEAYEQSLEYAVNQIRGIKKAAHETKEKLDRDRLEYQMKKLLS
ncbi:MAG: hypothetical protein COU11_00870 [Candidatus Harrisonbacteria bacterium CG10_big_fil_rev_8_21_14_0_10_49_15]|uniref:Uncharacterized protein n=1 Tax=Candidatus Harrisonbacteria bacterium CG10_big_fil_rev_8_21_14_0_10_49_15 TaxID=1974587 RepID=A0A2H0UNM6_9BACT|nr:MAG: hypothetical protein COU11_00870 [Candidatus Harrisonbacteria bacterium CG10_big_fil_rev_8_21_14_0_10_49_15]